MLPGPATLWGILASDCEAPESDEGYEPAEDYWSATSTDTGDQDEFSTADFSDACPALLWGILLPEKGGCGELDLDTFISLWSAAGYDSQVLIEEDALSSPAAHAVPVGDEESLQHPVGPYIVKESPGKGQGIFAARDISKGERVLMDKPFFIVTKPYNNRKVLEEFERLPLARRQQYMQLWCPDRRDVSVTDVTCIFEANCFNIGESAAVFLTATRFNHSCLPNTYYAWSGSEIVFHSMIPISEGAEMTISYGYPFLSRLERWSELHIYNFRCTCPACEAQTSFGRESESRRLAMKALEEQIIMFQSELDKALLSYGLSDPLTAILRLIELVKEERLYGELMTPYRDAAEHLKGRGNFEEALRFARLELDEEVVCCGVDSAVVRKTVEYIEELEMALGAEALGEHEGTEGLEEDGEVEELGPEDETAEPESDADTQELEIDSEKAAQAQSRNEVHDEPENDTEKDENTLDNEPKETEPPVIESAHESNEVPIEARPSTPSQDTYNLDHKLHAPLPQSSTSTTDDDDDDDDGAEPYEICSSSGDPLISSQSSSPRLVRKK